MDTGNIDGDSGPKDDVAYTVPGTDKVSAFFNNTTADILHNTLKGSFIAVGDVDGVTAAP
jgi:hypothetical protein